MSAAAVLVILVVTGEAQRPEMAALLSAAGDVAGATGAVRVIETHGISDAEALRVEHDLEAAAVVQLSWRDPERLRARLRLHAVRTSRWIDRELQFSPGDTPTERGRTLGFAIASMLPEGDPELRIQPPVAPSVSSAPPPPTPPGRHAAGASLAVGVGLGGPAGGIGGALAAETLVSDRASIGLKLAARGGRISEVDARSLTVIAGAGAALHLLAPDGPRPLGLAVRIDGLVLYHAVAHAGPGGTQWKGHLMPGADLELEAIWRLARAVELVFAGGVEMAFGTVDVTVVAAPPASGMATIPVARAVAALGARVRF